MDAELCDCALLGGEQRHVAIAMNKSAEALDSIANLVDLDRAIKVGIDLGNLSLAKKKAGSQTAPADSPLTPKRPRLVWYCISPTIAVTWDVAPNIIGKSPCHAITH